MLEATSHGLDLYRLDHTRFVIAAVTNVTHEHLEHHKTIDAYRRAKGRLFERVEEVGGTCVINLDDEGAREMRQYAPSIDMVGYSISDRSRRSSCGPPISTSGQWHVVLSELARNRCRDRASVDRRVQRRECPLRSRGCNCFRSWGWTRLPSGLRNAPEIPGRMTRVDRGTAILGHRRLCSYSSCARKPAHIASFTPSTKDG